MKKIFRYARSESPVGEVANLHINIQPRAGCQVLKCVSVKDLRRLRPGQLHTSFVYIRVTEPQTQEIDLNNNDSILRSSWNKNSLKRDTQNALDMGASEVHLLTVQLLYQDSLDDVGSWRYIESPLFAFRKLGNIAEPQSTTLELYRPFFFFIMSRLRLDIAVEEIIKLTSRVEAMEQGVRNYIECVQSEILFHKEITEYENVTRRDLTHHYAPIHIPDPHEWVVARGNMTREKE